jgi:TolA-binding protein
MKAHQRHQLKQNEFATTVARVGDTVREHRSRIAVGIVAAVVVAGAIGGYLVWRKHTRDQAGALFAQATAISDAPIAPAPTVPGAAQAAGTFATVKARQEAAVAAFERVAKAYPSTDDGIAASYELAGELLSLGRLPEAEKAYQDVIARAGSSIYGASARMGLAETLTAEGQYDRAIKEYTDLAAQRDGVLPVDGVLFQLGRTYLKAGKAADARAAFKRIADEFPNSNYVADAREQLSRLG